MRLLLKRNFTEADLYQPVHQWLVNNGFEVQAEVKNCDIVALREGETTILELKKTFNLKLIYQCLDRQKYCDYCYAVFPYSDKKGFRKGLKDIKHLLKKLGIGLLLVRLYQKSNIVEEVLSPKKNKFRGNRHSRSIQKEISKRTGNYNKGGVSGEIITAYREQSILIYYLMTKYELEKPKDIVAKGGPPNTSRILRDNHYNWFHKLARGTYTFDIDFETMRSKYQEVFEHIEQHF